MIWGRTNSRCGEGLIIDVRRLTVDVGGLTVDVGGPTVDMGDRLLMWGNDC